MEEARWVRGATLPVLASPHISSSVSERSAHLPASFPDRAQEQAERPPPPLVLEPSQAHRVTTSTIRAPDLLPSRQVWRTQRSQSPARFTRHRWSVSVPSRPAVCVCSSARPLPQRSPGRTPRASCPSVSHGDRRPRWKQNKRACRSDLGVARCSSAGAFFCPAQQDHYQIMS